MLLKLLFALLVYYVSTGTAHRANLRDLFEPAQVKRQTETSEACDQFVQKLNAFWSQLDEDDVCTMNYVTQTLLDLDVSDEQVRKQLACLFVDNSEDIGSLFTALDNAGWVDKILRLGYDALAMGAAMNGPYIRGLPYQYGMQQCRTNGYMRGMDQFLQSAEESIGLQSISDFAAAVTELDIFSLDTERTVALSGMLMQGMMFFATPNIPEPCMCSAVTDPAERCRNLQEAANPIINFLNTDPQVKRYLDRGIADMQEQFGSNFLADFEADASKIVCELAKMQSVEDIRQALNNIGMTQPLFEFAYVQFLSWATPGRYNYEYLIKQEERYLEAEGLDPNEWYGWRPSEEELARARESLAFYDAIYDAFGCLSLNYMSERQDRRDRRECYDDK